MAEVHTAKNETTPTDATIKFIVPYLRTFARLVIKNTFLNRHGFASEVQPAIGRLKMIGTHQEEVFLEEEHVMSGLLGQGASSGSVLLPLGHYVSNLLIRK